ncbi:unnamed protein product [Symbiodinium natans]|uniref:Uncharacterized protein n=1 Tax=Symbiodinium natans TaxID=878477 RepID=A0A812U974_9DINO|nr:unnamed protein product [Symbiodinium natans]
MMHVQRLLIIISRTRGLCDLCNLEHIPDLHCHGQGRQTHLLMQLAEPEAELALDRIKEMASDSIATDLRARMPDEHAAAGKSEEPVHAAADAPRVERCAPAARSEQAASRSTTRKRRLLAAELCGHCTTMRADKRGIGLGKDQKVPGKIQSMLKDSFEEVDEGQLLTIRGEQFKKCCLALSVARALGGLDAPRTDVQKRAESWIMGLPEYLQSGVAKNEATAGEMLFEHYLNKVVQEDETVMVCLVLMNANVTRVWAGVKAALASCNVLYLKYASGRFTSLLAKDAGTSTETLLKALPPLQCFSFIGSSDLKHEMCKAQNQQA